MGGDEATAELLWRIEEQIHDRREEQSNVESEMRADPMALYKEVGVNQSVFDMERMRRRPHKTPSISHTLFSLCSIWARPICCHLFWSRLLPVSTVGSAGRLLDGVPPHRFFPCCDHTALRTLL